MTSPLELVKRHYRNVSAANFDGEDELFSPDVETIDPGAGTLRGIAAFAQMFGEVIEVRLVLGADQEADGAEMRHHLAVGEEHEAGRIGAGLGGVAGEGSEKEDSEEAAVGDGGDGEAGFDDVALASGVDAVDGDPEEDDGPEDGT